MTLGGDQMPMLSVVKGPVIILVTKINKITALHLNKRIIRLIFLKKKQKYWI